MIHADGPLPSFMYNYYCFYYYYYYCI